MGDFDPVTPFPLFDSSLHTPSELRSLAQQTDEWLGLRIPEIESKLAAHGCRKRAPDSSKEKQQLWFGLEPQKLLTPYSEIRALLESLNLQPGQTVVDLGAAYGRMGFVIARCFPLVNFIGYEYVGERVEESRRCLARFSSCANVRMEHADLAAADFAPVEADIYFIYDFGPLKAIEKTLYDLKRLARRRPVILVGRGRHSRYLIETRHRWLTCVDPHAPEGPSTIYKGLDV